MRTIIPKVSLLAPLFGLALSVGGQQPWRISLGGVGPLRLGMALPEIRRIAGEEDIDPSGCFGASPKTPSGLRLFVRDSELVLIVVENPSIATVSGVRVGDLEDRIA